MAEVFRCPSCSGRLEYDGGDHATVRCDYCGSTVIVPQSLRRNTQAVSNLYGHQSTMHEVVRLINAGQRDEAATLFAATFGVNHTQAQEAVARLADGLSLSTQHVSIQAGSGSGAGRRLGCIIGLVVMLVVVGTVVVPLLAGGAAVWSFFAQEPMATEVAQIVREVQMITPRAPAPAGPQGYATLIDSFGSEGIAPGQFVDPRAMAVAPDGVVYIADYSNGRVQRFNGEGNSQGVWQWNKDQVIQSLAVGAQGELLAVQAGNLVRFSRESGEPLGELTYTSNTLVSFRDVAVAPNGDIVALNHFGEYVRFDAVGNVLHVVNLEEAAEINSADRLAVDGRGNVYMLAVYQDVLGKRQNGVFMFSNEGRYLSRFGSTGREPGQFTSPSAIAVDGQGRIYVSDFPGILTFANSGSYLGVTDTEGFVFGITFNNQGEMLATGNANKLFRFSLP